MSVNKKVIYISVYSDIYFDKVKSIMDTCANIIAQRETEKIYFLFSSSGGQVDPAITLYNYLRILPINITMHNTGSIDSSANIVFLSGNERFATQHASFLFHGIIWTYPPNTTQTIVTKNQMIEAVSQIEISESKISGIITERTSLCADEVKKLFNQGEAKDSEYALSKGIIQGIKDPIIPKDAPLISL